MTYCTILYHATLCCSQTEHPQTAEDWPALAAPAADDTYRDPPLSSLEDREAAPSTVPPEGIRKGGDPPNKHPKLTFSSLLGHL